MSRNTAVALLATAAVVHAAFVATCGEITEGGGAFASCTSPRVYDSSKATTASPDEAKCCKAASFYCKDEKKCPHPTCLDGFQMETADNAERCSMDSTGVEKPCCDKDKFISHNAKCSEMMPSLFGEKWFCSTRYDSKNTCCLSKEERDAEVKATSFPETTAAAKQKDASASLACTVHCNKYMSGAGVNTLFVLPYAASATGTADQIEQTGMVCMPAKNGRSDMNPCMQIFLPVKVNKITNGLVEGDASAPLVTAPLVGEQLNIVNAPGFTCGTTGSFEVTEVSSTTSYTLKQVSAGSAFTCSSPVDGDTTCQDVDFSGSWPSGTSDPKLAECLKLQSFCTHKQTCLAGRDKDEDVVAAKLNLKTAADSLKTAGDLQATLLTKKGGMEAAKKILEGAKLSSEAALGNLQTEKARLGASLAQEQSTLNNDKAEEADEMSKSKRTKEDNTALADKITTGEAAVAAKRKLVDDNDAKIPPLLQEISIKSDAIQNKVNEIVAVADEITPATASVATLLTLVTAKAKLVTDVSCSFQPYVAASASLNDVTNSALCMIVKQPPTKVPDANPYSDLKNEIKLRAACEEITKLVAGGTSGVVPPPGGWVPTSLDWRKGLGQVECGYGSTYQSVAPNTELTLADFGRIEKKNIKTEVDCCMEAMKYETTPLSKGGSAVRFDLAADGTCRIDREVMLRGNLDGSGGHPLSKLVACGSSGYEDWMPVTSVSAQGVVTIPKGFTTFAPSKGVVIANAAEYTIKVGDTMRMNSPPGQTCGSNTESTYEVTAVASTTEFTLKIHNDDNNTPPTAVTDAAKCTIADSAEKNKYHKTPDAVIDYFYWKPAAGAADAANLKTAGVCTAKHGFTRVEGKNAKSVAISAISEDGVVTSGEFSAAPLVDDEMRIENAVDKTCSTVGVFKVTKVVSATTYTLKAVKSMTEEEAANCVIVSTTFNALKPLGRLPLGPEIPNRIQDNGECEDPNS